MDQHEELYCAYCQRHIEGNYFIIGDNYLQAKYFDSEEDNKFCSKECVCDALFIMEIEHTDIECEVCA